MADDEIPGQTSEPEPPAENSSNDDEEQLPLDPSIQSIPDLNRVLGRVFPLMEWPRPPKKGKF